MKNTVLKILGTAAILCSVVSCGGTGGNNQGKTGFINASLLGKDVLGASFEDKYLPDTQNIPLQSGKIDVCLDFDGNQYGWQKVANEYKRLHNNQVEININTNYSGSTYGEKLNSELNNINTDWDICEGNLGYGNTNKNCLNVSSFGNMNNYYCGANAKWQSALEDTTFKNVEADAADVYLVNSETMQSAWFVNKVALDAAAALGYRNADDKPENPITWDDLISLCDYMQQAGYENPLGISLTAAAVKSLQFTWLLRIYGDYYYRSFYRYIMSAEYWDDYDPENVRPEHFDGYGTVTSKILNIMLDKNTDFGPGFVGPGSEIYKDFVGQLAKMKGYLVSNPDTTEFNALRDQFRMQSLGKNSAQIMLDYLGNGLVYSSNSTADFKIDYFDYPTMQAGTWQSGNLEGEDYVPEGTITRDIGGNGGFLSIIKHVGNSKQNDLNLDFLKFFMSPYGQTLYYQGLSDNNVAPKGLTTCKHVVIPEKWSQFFNESSSKVTFNGNVDGNRFITYGVRYYNGYTNTENCICQLWRGLLMTNLGPSATLNVGQFCTKWYDACFKDYQIQCTDCSWDNELYLNPYANV